jgi:hypothetical protein
MIGCSILVSTANCQDPYPIQISNEGEDVEKRLDLRTSHEEADIIIIQQALKCAPEARKMTVISDDTDVFVLLLYHYQRTGLSIPIYMESPIKGRTVIDISTSAKKHSRIISDLLLAHALSGCDTVACYYGIGKGSTSEDSSGWP